MFMAVSALPHLHALLTVNIMVPFNALEEEETYSHVLRDVCTLPQLILVCLSYGTAMDNIVSFSAALPRGAQLPFIKLNRALAPDGVGSACVAAVVTLPSLNRIDLPPQEHSRCGSSL